jgi:hypothetical protein
MMGSLKRKTTTFMSVAGFGEGDPGSEVVVRRGALSAGECEFPPDPELRQQHRQSTPHHNYRALTPGEA